MCSRTVLESSASEVDGCVAGIDLAWPSPYMFNAARSCCSRAGTKLDRGGGEENVSLSACWPSIGSKRLERADWDAGDWLACRPQLVNPRDCVRSVEAPASC